MLNCIITIAMANKSIMNSVYNCHLSISLSLQKYCTEYIGTYIHGDFDQNYDGYQNY